MVLSYHDIVILIAAIAIALIGLLWSERSR